MKGLVIAASLVLVLGAAPRAQTPAGQPPAPAGQAPAPAAPAAPQAAPQPPAPFPQGARIGYVYLQQIAAVSNEGKAATGKVNALIQKKQAEGAEKQKLLQGNQQKLQTGGGVMSEQARAQLQKEIEKQTVEAQRFDQDAQAEVNELQQQLQEEFQKKLIPVLEVLARERGLYALFSAADTGFIWADPGLDLTAEAVRRLDATTGKPAAAAPATAKPAPAPTAKPSPPPPGTAAPAPGAKPTPPGQ
jgi:Skp family chaperone for outer membrane proteins